MKPSLRKLYSYFKLEVERGFDNNAVMGGLDHMLDHWEAEARADDLNEDLIQAVCSRVRDYPRLSASSRVETLKGLWSRIQRDESVPSLEFDLQQSTSKPAPEPEVRPDRPVDSQIKEISEDSQASPASDEKIAAAASPPGKTADVALSQERRKAAEPAATEPVALDAAVTVLPGIGDSHAATLNRLGLVTLRDMLYYFPRRYDDYSLLKPINRLSYGEELTVIGTVQSVGVRKMRGGRTQMVEVVISDGSGALRITWFNQSWIARRLRQGAQMVVSGKVDQYLGRFVMNNPEWEYLDQQQLNTNRIVPVYPLTAKLTQRRLRRMMNQVVSYWALRVRDPLPPDIRQSAGLVDLSTALLQIHFPDTWDDLEAARSRLAFDEIFLLQLGVLAQKRTWQDRTAHSFAVDESWLGAQLTRLPYTLTNAQKQTLDDVRQDLSSGHPMNRLLQGDVGSGKTVIAALSCGIVAREGAQCALMAPTSILAEQHLKNLVQILVVGEGAPLRDNEIRLLLGATPESEKEEIRASLADGTIKLLVGTHALIEAPVDFADLQLVIVDEQHRFGVRQRAALRSKGENPHLMVMTATPIPRSLALTVYGDLDLSVIDEMPPGRIPVSTYVLTPRELERAYTLIRSEIGKGHQAFVVYPLVEESEKSQAKAAVEEHAYLQEKVFPKFSLGLLHGRMRADEKEDVMARFRDGEYQVLVSTTVIEVGVDVPNASVMLVEGANRYGLSQLHQLRGRVGRGSEKSYCLLVPDTPDAVENERLGVMAETNDGFVLAERDLEQRGPGEFLGTRQSGFAELQIANLTDVRLIEKARRQAKLLFDDDIDLVKPQHRYIAAAVESFWSSGEGDIS